MKTVKITLGIMVLFAFSGINEVSGQWTTSGNDIYNSNSGNVGIGNNAPSTLLFVAKNMTEPTITVRNLGGAGGATYSMIDNTSGADWKFKATNTGGFKIRDNANGLDVFLIEPNSAANALYINAAGNIGIGTNNPSDLLHIVGGDVKIGNTSGDARKLYFGDGAGVYIGEEATDNRMGLSATSLTLNINGATGTDGQVLTSNGITCLWEDLPAGSDLSGTGTTDYLARWLSPNTLGIGLIRDDNSTVGINIPPDPGFRLKVEGGSGKTAVYGRYDANHYGYLGSADYGVYGYYNGNRYGYLASSDYGVYGIYDLNHYGYIGGSAYGVYGSNNGTTIGNAGVYGNNGSNAAGTPGVYGNNNTSNLYGTNYLLNNSCNGVVGNVYFGTAYHFGVFGTRFDDSGGPSAGVLGTVNVNNSAQPWGALGYQDATSVEYAGYFNGNIRLTAGLHDGSGYGAAGSVLHSNGSNDVYWSTLSFVGGTGAINYIPKWSNATTLTNSLIYDNGTNVGIGTISPTAKLNVNSSSASTSVYGQYSANILGYLGSSSYGAFGQYNATRYGCLGATNYGVYGQYDTYINGFLGGSEYGAYGQFSSSVKGYLGSLYYGAYGQWAADRFGYLGGQNYGAYGQYSADRYGYMGSSPYGVYGQYNSNIYGILGTVDYGVKGQRNTQGGAAGYFYHSAEPASYVQQWATDVYMANATTNDGTSYAYGANNSGGLRAYNYNGATYTFGVGGWNYNDENRCAGVFGANIYADYWGALGYRSSGNVNYGGYFTTSGTGSGKSFYETNGEGIGVGAWGGLMGADFHGGVYGIYVEGENAALYAKGPVFTNYPVIQLQETNGTQRTALYSSSSTEVNVLLSGQGQLVNGQCNIKFDDDFMKVISNQSPLIITATPMGPTNGVYVASSDYTGFSISENNNGRNSTSFSYIVIGKRAGYENPELAEEVISTEFEKMMSRGLHNDSDLSTQGEGLYYQNGRLMTGQAPGSQNRNIK